MTREMNKPDWEQKYYWQRVDYDVYIAKERKLDEDWPIFIKELNKNLGVND